MVEHDIDTGDSRPMKQSPRRPPIAAREAENEILDEMLATGEIQPSNSSWASAVCLVKKKDGTFRFCIDYRRVNAASKRMVIVSRTSRMRLIICEVLVISRQSTY